MLVDKVKCGECDKAVVCKYREEKENLFDYIQLNTSCGDTSPFTIILTCKYNTSESPKVYFPRNISDGEKNVLETEEGMFTRALNNFVDGFNGAVDRIVESGILKSDNGEEVKE